ncbi:hypothetical protein A3G06_02075 [Candidatus Nomurabacteria bacterium RIFCSPLOWO2_12_FULL_46_14]|uniref:Uncharacterized protein n=1 Tax=Candidatus Nomurabacteria bacterium RIFCSPLOWO2_12_FULL_46_14 TaxID=1801797 RepID=A0A1F6YD41_9BACT|nr:MAG: hypothetical protein A3G06_02075 [Candidatus Nomurabacteria bacterium RIFCSPLOWO2_12_FULL_46_14]
MVKNRKIEKIKRKPTGWTRTALLSTIGFLGINDVWKFCSIILLLIILQKKPKKKRNVNNFAQTDTRKNGSCEFC